MERKVTLEHYALFARFEDGKRPSYNFKTPDTRDGFYQLWSKFNSKTTFDTRDDAFNILADWSRDGVSEYKIVKQVWDITETDIETGMVKHRDE
jgi:hypothetical protein